MIGHRPPPRAVVPERRIPDSGNDRQVGGAPVAMARESRYDILFEPVRIGPVTAKNRAIRAHAPHPPRPGLCSA